MSTTIPSRTRSLRKPSDAGNSRYGRSPVSGASIEGDAPALGTHPAATPRSGQSPSRLPVKPPTRSTTSITRPPSAGSSTTSNASMRPPPPRANISKSTTSSGGLQRSTSTRRPSESSHSTTSSGLQRSTSTRRPSDASNPTASADPIKQDRSRPPLTQYKHLRNASTSSSISSTSNPPPRGHTRNKSSSSSSLLNASNALRPPSREASNPAKPLARDSSNPPKQPVQSEPHTQLQAKKATFSTYQQHFSPAKSLAPKPHPAAFLAPPSPSKLPSNIAISAETAKLQNELLQLHLLHKDAGVVNEQWKSSAKRKLGARFQSVVIKHDRLVELETEETGRINAVGFKRWQEKGVPGWGLEERVRVLDEVLTGVWSLGESGGKFSRLVRRFEKWLVRSGEILDAREAGEGFENDEVVFVEELERGWKDECLNLNRKLEGWEGNLKDLGVPDGESSLKSVVERCRVLIEGMLEELSVMRRIEDEVLRRETDWIKGLNEDVSDDDDDRPVAGAIWRSR